MARREWADKIVKQEMTGYHWNARIKKSTVILPDIAAKLLVKEHARAVRIVKKKIRGLEACIASDKRDGNEAGATLHVYALSILNSTLVEMQKGRA